MTPLGAAPGTYTPIFDWKSSRRRKISLVSFLAASAMVHALCFYIFQIVYPPTVALLPPPARVNLITADSEEGRLLLRWVEAEDPALSSTTQRPPDAISSMLPDRPHVPSYMNRPSALKQLPPYQPDLRIPSAQPPGPVMLPRAAPAPAPSILASSLRFADEGKSLGRPEIPPLHFEASTKEPPTAARFRVGIDARGALTHCFLENSSGDPALDERARRYLLLSRFPAPPPTPERGDQLVWTTALFEWGNDVAVPSALQGESPAP